MRWESKCLTLKILPLTVSKVTHPQVAKSVGKQGWTLRWPKSKAVLTPTNEIRPAVGKTHLHLLRSTGWALFGFSTRTLCIAVVHKVNVPRLYPSFTYYYYYYFSWFYLRYHWPHVNPTNFLAKCRYWSQHIWMTVLFTGKKKLHALFGFARLSFGEPILFKKSLIKSSKSLWKSNQM